jgi:GxxExxY protein
VDVNDVSGEVVDSAIRVHTALGPGLLESPYEACLAHELRKRGLKVLSQVPMPIHYDDVRIDIGYRVDLFVEDLVIVELKAQAKLTPFHQAQLLTYLKLSRCKVGLLINFHEVHLKDGIRRLVN